MKTLDKTLSCVSFKKTVLVILLAIANCGISQNFPYGFNYQAVARDANGNAKTNVQVGVKFLIKVGNGTTGTLIWEENHGPVNTNSMGQFNITVGQGTRIAGSVTNFSDIKWQDTTYFLDAQIQTGPFTFVSIGVQRLMAVPYALSAPDPTPSGIIQAFAGSTAPAGYIICDGRAVARAGVYAKLFAAIGTAYGSGDGSTTFNIPDLRGMFLRGVDGAAGNDADKATRVATAPGGNTGNAVGSEQGDAMQGHQHGWRGNKTVGVSGGGSSWIPRGNLGSDANYTANDGGVILNPSTDGTNGTPRTTNETRPKNVYVNYMIKY